MPCTAEQLKAAAILALYAAVRLRMWGLEKLSVRMEHVALRLDNLSLFEAPVTLDPLLLEQLCNVIAEVRSTRGEVPWFLSSLVEELRCAGVECDVHREGGNGEGQNEDGNS